MYQTLITRRQRNRGTRTQRASAHTTLSQDRERMWTDMTDCMGKVFKPEYVSEEEEWKCTILLGVRSVSVCVSSHSSTAHKHLNAPKCNINKNLQHVKRLLTGNVNVAIAKNA